ncbi:polyhydroxyalkanoate synthesis repressor PhaR [Paroceanicella profunda]|uniref:polyhydroxyalkanoate synthesis repressor PhaR n=1 Tax=Paroceanicella profunda TaxID=2579971 RepID=UPI0019800771|nr:polyhydroxyalkanoate synthesis repressor PhaR [Paroceanicella profunda]
MDAEKQAPVVIKKYANRRLYNTSKSTYVTLEHLAEMVREGTDFVVNDAKSGDDITHSVLTQIIFEEESRGQSMLPISFLRQLIRLYGDTLQGFVPGYLEASMNTFASNQEAMREKVRAALDANPAFANFETMARTNMEWFENAMRMFAPFAGAARASDAEKSGESGAEPRASVARDTELEDMKSQLAEMQTQLSKLVGKS